MLTEEEYKKEWESGLHQSEYNSCRFADDKIAYGREWLEARVPGINLDNPKTLIDRIGWCKLYDTDKRKVEWADKINAYNTLVKQGMSELTVNAIRYEYDKFTERDYNMLNNGKYIIKCNHGSGWNLKFEKTNTSNPQHIIDEVNNWISLDYSYIAGWEWQYHEIKPGYIIQPYVGDNIMDWSFWCENGEIEYIGLTSKLAKNIQRYIAFTDANGKKSDFKIGMRPELDDLPATFKNIVQKMKPYVLEFSKGFKFVRVDMWYINNQVKFGELTFTPCAGVLK